MMNEPSEFKAHYADKIMRELSLSKLKTIENARMDEIENRSSDKKVDDRIDLIQKKITY